MGWISELDTEHEHEGYIVMTYADGKVSSGTSNGFGHYLDGYTYIGHGYDSEIDPAYLRPFSDTRGWLPTCECGWTGVEVEVIETGTDIDKYREPTPTFEDLIMGQWRLHLRDTLAPVKS